MMDIRLTVLAYISTGFFLIHEAYQLKNNGFYIIGIFFIFVAIIIGIGITPCKFLKRISHTLHNLFITPLYLVSFVAFLSAIIDMANSTKQYYVLWAIPIVAIIFLLFDLVEAYNAILASIRMNGIRFTIKRVAQTICFLSLLSSLSIIVFNIDMFWPLITWLIIATVAFITSLFLDNSSSKKLEN